RVTVIVARSRATSTGRSTTSYQPGPSSIRGCAEGTGGVPTSRAPTFTERTNTWFNLMNPVRTVSMGSPEALSRRNGTSKAIDRPAGASAAVPDQRGSLSKAPPGSMNDGTNLTLRPGSDGTGTWVKRVVPVRVPSRRNQVTRA